MFVTIAEASKDDNDGDDQGGHPPADGGGLGGMHVGVSMADIEASRQTSKAVDDVNAAVQDLDKDLKALKSRPMRDLVQISSMNGVLNMIQSEMSFKLDKELFEQGMEAKLDKDEFYSRMNEGGIGEDFIKRIEIDIKKLGKRSDNQDDELSRKIKKLKKKIEEGETKTNLYDEQLNELMEFYKKIKSSQKKGDKASTVSIMLYQEY